jgi:hypothetical protein
MHCSDCSDNRKPKFSSCSTAVPVRSSVQVSAVSSFLVDNGARLGLRQGESVIVIEWCPYARTGAKAVGGSWQRAGETRANTLGDSSGAGADGGRLLRRRVAGGPTISVPVVAVVLGRPESHGGGDGHDIGAKLRIPAGAAHSWWRLAATEA